MKSMTEIIRVIGQKEHKGINELVDEVYNVCKQHGVVTKNKNDITRGIVEYYVKRVIGKIRSGHKAWSDWGIIQSRTRLKLFIGDVIEFRNIKNYVISEFENDIQIRFEVQPILKGISDEPFIKSFANYKNAKQFYTENKDMIVATRLLIGDKLLEINIF